MHPNKGLLLEQNPSGIESYNIDSNNLSQENLDFHKRQKATTSLTKQVMTPRLKRELKVNQAVLVRETLLQILLSLRGLRREYLKSQGKGVGLLNYISEWSRRL